MGLSSIVSVARICLRTRVSSRGCNWSTEWTVKPKTLFQPNGPTIVSLSCSSENQQLSHRSKLGWIMERITGDHILCGVDCNHTLDNLWTLTSPYEDNESPKSQVYKLPGNIKATEAQVILNRLGRPLWEDFNSSNIQICPIRKKELLNLRSRSIKPKCELCTGTRHTKRITILRSAFFQDSGMQIYAGQVICEACTSNHRDKFQDWSHGFIEKLKTRAEVGMVTMDLQSSDEMNPTIAGDMSGTMEASGDTSEMVGGTSVASVVIARAAGDNVSDKENWAPNVDTSNGRPKAPRRELFKLDKLSSEAKKRKIKHPENSQSECNANFKRLRCDSETVPCQSAPLEINESGLSKDVQEENVIQQSQLSDESSKSSQSIEDKTAELDEDYVDMEANDKAKFELLQNFFREITNGEILINYKWNSENISERVEQSRSNLLSKMVHEVLKTIFPGGSESYYEKLIDKTFRSDNTETKSIMMLNKMIEAYQNSQSKEVKKYLAMELSLVMKFNELKDLLPGFTLYQYKLAQKNLKQAGLTQFPKEGYQNVTRNRRDIDSTVAFVQFMLTFVRDVSYGATEIELSSGEKVTCQNAVQEVVTEVIIRMYERHYQEEKESYEELTTLPYPIKLFGRTTLRNLAKTIPLGALKSLRGLDYFAAAGSEAFDAIRKDLKNKVLPRAASDQDMTEIQNLEISLQQAHRHLKTEFKEEISSSSRVAAHCSVWALSDPKDPHFSSVCDHQHDSRCSQCDMRSTSLDQYKHLVNKLFPSDTFEDRETRFEMLENISCIEEWVKHEVRGYHQNLKEKGILDSLTNRRSAHATFDLAMKWLPRKFREPMDAWFAQRGLGWQVFLLWFREEPNSEIQIQAFVQIFGAEKQDCFANYSCLDYTISEVKLSHPELEVLSMSSDNAGNYHNNLAMTTLIPAIGEKYNLSLISYDFKEPQKGKGPVDARIASMKKNMLVHLNSGKDVATTFQMKDAIEAFTGVKGTKVCVIKPNRDSETQLKTKKPIAGVSKLYSFTYERSQNGEWSLRYRQHSDIGRGKVMILGKVEPSPLNPTVLSPYSSSVSSNDTSVQIKPKRGLNAAKKAYPCSEEGCLLSFESGEMLENHISSGNHKMAGDIKNNEDRTKLLFVDHINKGRVVTLNYLKRLEEVAAPVTQLEQGWALKTREKGGPLPEPAKIVLRELYETGKDTKRKLTPEEGSKILRRRFPNEEAMWLKPSQVKSQFAIMTKADKNLNGQDEDDLAAVDERRLLQQAGEMTADIDDVGLTEPVTT